LVFSCRSVVLKRSVARTQSGAWIRRITPSSTSVHRRLVFHLSSVLSGTSTARRRWFTISPDTARSVTVVQSRQTSHSRRSSARPSTSSTTTTCPLSASHHPAATTVLSCHWSPQGRKQVKMDQSETCRDPRTSTIPASQSICPVSVPLAFALCVQQERQTIIFYAC